LASYSIQFALSITRMVLLNITIWS
jgi:hypothetical protein